MGPKGLNTPGLGKFLRAGTIVSIHTLAMPWPGIGQPRGTPMSALPEVTCKVIFLNILAELHMTRTYLTDLTIEGTGTGPVPASQKKPATCGILSDPMR